MNRDPIQSILMVVAGVILLLPGVCAVGFMILAGCILLILPLSASGWAVF